MPRTWTEDYPEPRPTTPEVTTPTPTPIEAARVVGQIMQLILEVLRDREDLLDQFNAGLVPIRAAIRDPDFAKQTRHPSKGGPL
jgi:hypothetical protein